MMTATMPGGFSGWVRACGTCGTVDLRSIYPVASMVDDPFWRCDHCRAAGAIALYVAVPTRIQEDR